MKKATVLMLVIMSMLTLDMPLQTLADDIAPETKEKLDRIGEWDGVTEKAELQGSYVNPYEQELPFGERSFFHVPWRGYMDTWDTSKWNNVLGIGFNNVTPAEADATAQVLAEAGFHRVRIEIGWGAFSYEDETRLLPAFSKQVEASLQAFNKYHIRPLIVLNAHSSSPVPNRTLTIRLVQDAKKGDRELYVDNTQDLVPRYTGLTGQAPRANMFPVFTAIDDTTGKITLSAPLTKDIPAGEINVVKFKYQPFQGTVFADGTPNPAAQETVDGWIRYVKSVSAIVKNLLGTNGQADAGFDLEVWNEYSFASEFLSYENYYSPPLQFSKSLTFEQNGRKVEGPEVILAYTAQFVQDPANGLPGVKVISGFSNQRPWDNGYLWNGQTGISKHPYAGYHPVNSVVSQEISSPLDLKLPTFNYLGKKDEASSEPGSYFFPIHLAGFPEYWFYYYHSESMSRYLTPYPNAWTIQGRFTSLGGGKQAEYWMSETNLPRNEFIADVMKQTGITDLHDARLATLSMELGAKNTLRTFTFGSHKGMDSIFIYNVKENDASFSVIPGAFFDKLKETGGVLTDEARALAGPQIETIKHVSELLKSGKPIENPRPLQVDKLVEYKPRLVFQGDGTAEHPSRYHRDDFAVMPYQLDDHTFAVGYYVVTRNAFHVWDQTKDPLDPARYEMPDQTFDVTLSNIRGTNAQIYVYDPMRNIRVPAEIADSTDTGITVKLQTVDYPRFLVIEEDSHGTSIDHVALEKTEDGGQLTFTSNVDGEALVTWGKYPVRQNSSFHEQSFTDEEFTELESEKNIDIINYKDEITSDEPRKGSWRWTGTIVPAYTEEYTFIADSDNNKIGLYINGQQVIKPDWSYRGSIHLEAGKAYDIRLDYATPYQSQHKISLYWFSDSQPKEIVPASIAGKSLQIPVQKGQKVSLPLPGFRKGDGVKVKLTGENGIINEFPRWNYDLRGVMYH